MIFEDFKTTGARAPCNLGAAKKVFKKYKMKFNGLEDGFRSTREPALLGYEELGWLVRSKTQDT